jgi:hypothetical protein
MNKNVFIYRNFEGVGMQVSTEKTGMFYASVYLKYNPLYDDENPAVWETALDTTIYGRPHIIDDLSDSSKKIIAFDIFGNIYMLNSGGKILWKKPLNAKPLGDVWMMDPKKNNEYGIAFCTADRLWLLDMKGKAVDNYPVSLSAKAAGPITVLDPGNKKQYLILYPGTNKKMNCISASGSINKQWTATNLKNSISAQPVYIMTGNKDYIVFWDKSGSLYFTDKTGKANLKLKQSFKKAVNSKVYLDDATASGFITTDEKGRIASITAGGNVAFTTVGTFGSDHHFLFEDFDLDGEKDFIFFDRNTVFVYNRDEKLINQNALTGDIMPVQPRYFRFGDSYLLAAVSHENDHLILFNNTGLYDVLQKYSSTMAPVADFFYKGELPSIIAVSGKYIRYYDLDL